MGGALKKGVHTQLMRDTHNHLRCECFKHELSLQEVFEGFAHAIVAQDPRAMGLMKELAKQKRDNLLRSLTQIDAKSVYQTIELGSPFGKTSDDENS